MKIYLATDHAGFTLKEVIKEFLLGEGYDVEDCGAYTFNKDDDYPDFIEKAAAKVSALPTDRAIIFGGSGQAEMMLANKFPHVRAALFYGTKLPVEAADVTGRVSSDPYELIRLTREHNDANILSLGARFLTDDEACEACRLWLEAPFSNADHHMRRIKKITEIEQELSSRT